VSDPRERWRERGEEFERYIELKKRWGTLWGDGKDVQRGVRKD